METKQHNVLTIAHCMTLAVVVLVFYFISFAIVDAAEWYVRPEGGSYGSENGTSYANAWNGMYGIVWGTGGVEAGDTLYFCGTHVRTRAENNAFSGGWNIGVSGTPNDSVVVDGSCPDGEKGIQWGAYKDGRTGGMREDRWETLDDGVYFNQTSDWNKAVITSGLFEDIDGASYKRYTKLDSMEDVLNSNEDGVYYMEGFGNNRHKIWLRPFNESTFKKEIRWSGTGAWGFWINPLYSYLEIRDIAFIGQTSINFGYNENARAHDITFKDTVHIPIESSWAFNPQNVYNLIFDGVEIANAGNGIYVTRISQGEVSDVTIKNSYFHDLGIPWAGGGSKDGHGIGVQNSERFDIIGNRFERTGSAIDFHIGGSETVTNKDINIIGNRITDMRPEYAAVVGGSGIVLEGHNGVPKGQTENIVIAHNFISDCSGSGIFTSRKDVVKIYNNTIADCGSLSASGNRVDGASLHAYNNIILDPKGDYVWFNQNSSGIQYEFEADNNVYYPAPTTSGDFHFLVTDGIQNPPGVNVYAWPGWKEGHLAHGDVVEGKTIVTDPFPANTSDEYLAIADITPSAGSPIIDSGVDMGQTVDFLGNPIYGTPDRGAIEYQPPYILGVDPVYENQTIRIYGNTKYRYLEAPTPTSEQTSLFIASISEFSSEDYRHYADFTINAWNTGDDKLWTLETPGFIANDNLIAFLIGDVEPGATYALLVDNTLTSSTGVADSSGRVVLGYGVSLSSSHTFGLQKVSGSGEAPSPSSVLGCTDSSATNYNSSATEDDGSCTYNPATAVVTFGLAEETSIGADNTSGRFDIYVDVVAKYGDIYIADSMTNVNGETGNESILFGVDGNGLHLPASAFDSITTDITSTAESANGYFRIPEGEVETFTFRITVDASAEGFYRSGLATPFRYLLSEDGNVETLVLEEAEFLTDYLFIRGTTPEPDSILGCTDPSATNYNSSATEDDGSCTYSAPNTAPVANNDTYEIDADAVLTGVNILGNDTDADGDTLTVSPIVNLTGSQKGEFNVTTSGTLTFNPGNGFNNLFSDEFRDTTIAYTISDGVGTDTADVTVTVKGTKVKNVPDNNPAEDTPGKIKNRDAKNKETGADNTLTIKERALEDCTINRFSPISERDLRKRDDAFEYKLGLFDIEIDCVEAGGTVTIEIELDKVYDVSDWMLRKYRDDESYITVDDSLVEYVTRKIRGKDRTVIVFDITDGGVLDDDGLANGTIIDPVGPGEPIDKDPTPSQPSTFSGSGGGARISLSDPSYNEAFSGTLTDAQRKAILEQIRTLLVQILELQKKLIELRANGQVRGLSTDAELTTGMHRIFTGLTVAVDQMKK